MYCSASATVWMRSSCLMMVIRIRSREGREPSIILLRQPSPVIERSPHAVHCGRVTSSPPISSQELRTTAHHLRSYDLKAVDTRLQLGIRAILLSAQVEHPVALHVPGIGGIDFRLRLHVAGIPGLLHAFEDVTSGSTGAGARCVASYEQVSPAACAGHFPNPQPRENCPKGDKPCSRFELQPPMTFLCCAT